MMTGSHDVAGPGLSADGSRANMKHISMDDTAVLALPALTPPTFTISTSRRTFHHDITAALRAAIFHP